MKYYLESRRKGTSYMQENEGRLTGLVTSVRTALQTHVMEGKIEGMGR